MPAMAPIDDLSEFPLQLSRCHVVTSRLPACLSVRLSVRLSVSPVTPESKQYFEVVDNDLVILGGDAPIWHAGMAHLISRPMGFIFPIIVMLSRTVHSTYMRNRSFV